MNADAVAGGAIGTTGWRLEHAAAPCHCVRMSKRTPTSGYDPAFLGVPVPLPTSRSVRTIVLHYTHFSVVMRPDRGLAAATGVGIDGGSLVELDREGIEWRLDPRLPAENQAGPALYRDNDLDRGHLVRRSDPVWGTATEAAQANADTFYYTNAAPQQAEFNQSKLLWLGLEDYLLANAADYDRRLVVFTGPVLDPSDPLYRGVQIPLRYWKVAAFLNEEKLAATAYVLDQSPPDPDQSRGLVGAELVEPPPLGPYRTFQVPVADIAALTGLDLGSLPGVDRLRPAAGFTPAPLGGWAPLIKMEDVIY